MGTNMIGNKIAEARKKLNISQAQLAESYLLAHKLLGNGARRINARHYDFNPSC